MQLELSPESLSTLIEALNAAIHRLEADGYSEYANDLKTLKLSLVILAHKGTRSAAKEQRKARANDDGVAAAATIGKVFDNTIRVDRS